MVETSLDSAWGKLKSKRIQEEETAQKRRQQVEYVMRNCLSTRHSDERVRIQNFEQSAFSDEFEEYFGASAGCDLMGFITQNKSLSQLQRIYKILKPVTPDLARMMNERLIQPYEDGIAHNWVPYMLQRKFDNRTMTREEYHAIRGIMHEYKNPEKLDKTG